MLNKNINREYKSLNTNRQQKSVGEKAGAGKCIWAMAWFWLDKAPKMQFE